MQTAAAVVDSKSRQRAATELLTQYGWIVKSLQQRYGRIHPGFCEDLEQEGYLALIEAGRSFIPGSRALSSYIYSQVKFAMLQALNREGFDAEEIEDRLKGRRRGPGGADVSMDAERRQQPSDDVQTLHDLLGVAPDQESVLLAAEEWLELDRALQGLSDRESMCITLRFFENLALKEVASAMKMPLGSMGAYIERVLVKLRKSLIKRGMARD